MSDPWAPLPWQQAPWDRVQAALRNNRLPHALLLAGPRGVGRGHFARGISHFLLCEAPPETRKPCGQCRGCIQIAAGLHPNLFLVQTAEGKRDIAIDDLRDLMERLHLSSHYGQAKVVIFEPADALNISGVNALLKTVEEPPPATYLLFIAERWRALPATLRSRCQILRLGPPSETQALTWLQQQHPERNVSDLRAWIRAPLLAEAALDPDAVQTRQQWSSLLDHLAAGRLQALKQVQGLKRDEAQGCLNWLLQITVEWLRQLRAPASAVTAALPGSASATAVEALLDDTLEGLRGLDRNGNPSLILEWILIRHTRRAP